MLRVAIWQTIVRLCGGVVRNVMHYTTMLFEEHFACFMFRFWRYYILCLVLVFMYSCFVRSLGVERAVAPMLRKGSSFAFLRTSLIDADLAHLQRKSGSSILVALLWSRNRLLVVENLQCSGKMSRIEICFCRRARPVRWHRHAPRDGKVAEDSANRVERHPRGIPESLR